MTATTKVSGIDPGISGGLAVVEITDGAAAMSIPRQLLDRRVRRRAAEWGCFLHRTRRRKGPDNAGEFVLIREEDAVLLGAGFTATLEMILEFLAQLETRHDPAGVVQELASKAPKFASKTPPRTYGSRWIRSREGQCLRQHVLDLCDQHNISIYAWCRRLSECHALIDRDEIRITPITSRISYAAALHEIGHLRGKHQRSSSTLVRERWAWEWARTNALIWSPHMQRRVCEALKWYAQKRAGFDQGAELRRTAYHEAGHAVIARVLGLLVGSTTIVANHMLRSDGNIESDLDETMKHWRRPISEGGNKKLVLRSLPCASRAQIMMTMAGREAGLECLGTSRSNDRFGHGDHRDRKQIVELLTKIYSGASHAEWRRREDRLRRMTRVLVRRHRNKIERVACALLQHRTLSGKAIDALLFSTAP